MAKLTHEADRYGPFNAAKRAPSDIPGTGAGADVVLHALETHKTSQDHTTFEHLWKAVQTFLADTITGNILPNEPDVYNIGSNLQKFAKGYFNELSTVIFKKENVLVLDGTQIITKQAGKVVGDVADTDTQIDFGQTLTVGDFLVMKAEGQVEYMQVGALVSGTTYTVTRDLDGTGANAWPSGSVYAVRGHSGDAWLEKTVTVGAEARESIFVQGAAWNQSTEIVRHGVITGWQGSAFSGPGTAMGDFAGGHYMVYTTVDGLKIRGASITAGNGNVLIDNNGINLESMFSSSAAADIAAVKWFDLDNPNPDLYSKISCWITGTDSWLRIITSNIGKAAALLTHVTSSISRFYITADEITLNGEVLGTGVSETAAAFKVPKSNSGGKLDNNWLNASTSPTAYTLPLAGSAGKIDNGWLPDLQSLYAPNRVFLNASSMHGGSTSVPATYISGVPSLSFPDAATNYAAGTDRLPAGWAGQTVTVKISWASTVTGNVRWELWLLSAAVGKLVTATSVSGRVTSSSTVNTVRTASVNLTLNSTFVNDEPFVVGVSRIGADAADTLAGVAHLISVEVSKV